MQLYISAYQKFERCSHDKVEAIDAERSGSNTQETIYIESEEYEQGMIAKNNITVCNHGGRPTCPKCSNGNCKLTECKHCTSQNFKHEPCTNLLDFLYCLYEANKLVFLRYAHQFRFFEIYCHGNVLCFWFLQLMST